MITILLAVYQTTTIIIFPAILISLGLGGEYLLERKGKGFASSESPDLKTSRSDLTSTGYYALIGFLGLLVTGYAINFTKYITTLAITSVDAILYSALMAISEEMFFRGFILDFLLNRIKLWYIAIIIGAAIFTGYHLARYGTQIDSLAYVFGGGFILGWITYKSRRLGPAICSHILNNIVAVLGMV